MSCGHATSSFLTIPHTTEPVFTMSPQQQLAALDLTLPPAPAPTGVYKPILIVGRQVYVSGHGPVLPDGSMLAGRVGCD